MASPSRRTCVKQSCLVTGRPLFPLGVRTLNEVCVLHLHILGGHYQRQRGGMGEQKVRTCTRLTRTATKQ